MRRADRPRRILNLAAWLWALGLTATAGAANLVQIDQNDLAQLRQAIIAEQARAPTPRLARSAILALPQLRTVRLSPDGRQLAQLRIIKGERSLWQVAIDGSNASQRLTGKGLRDFLWSRDSRWLFVHDGRRLQALAMAGQHGSSTVAKLGMGEQRRLLSIDSSQDAAALLIERPLLAAAAGSRWRLLRVDSQGRQTVLHEDPQPIIDALIDGRGKLSYLLLARDDGHRIVQRTADGRLRERLRCEPLRRCGLLGLAEDGKSLWLQGNPDGAFERLLQLHDDGTLQTLHQDPRSEADLHTIARDPISLQPLLAHYHSIESHWHGLTPSMQLALEALQNKLGQRDLELQIAHGDSAPWLVQERAGSLRGERLHVYLPRERRIHSIPPMGFEWREQALPSLPESHLAHKWPLAWRASDGRRLHGFLHLPPGIDVKHAPLVALIHGGPFYHDGPEFSRDAQLLANRGYVVFQPNFRGSTGHGRDYLLSANGDFGDGRVQQDIVEGVRYLLQHGVGDAERVGIIGGSYGGYAALLGVTFEPDLFRVAAAAAAPAELGQALRRQADGRAEMQAGIAMRTSLKPLALDVDDASVLARLQAQSPLSNAQRIEAPLLLFGGGRDARVPARDIIRYAEKLQTLGKDVSLLIDPDAGHNLDTPLTREAWCFLLETLLHRHLGGAAAEPPDPALATYLRRHLRLSSATPTLAGSGKAL